MKPTLPEPDFERWISRGVSVDGFNASTVQRLIDEAYAAGMADAREADPLQGAVDWICQADGEFFCVATVQRTLRIGYNRAKRLCDNATSALPPPPTQRTEGGNP